MMYCENCGTELNDNAKFCDACGTQTAAEQTAILTRRAQNADAYMDKSVGGSVAITVAMILFSLVFIIFVGFDEGEPMVATIAAIAFSVFMTGLKWFFEIKAQKRYKRAAEKNAGKGGGNVL